MGDTESQLAISCHQMRHQVLGLGCIQWVVGQRGPKEIPQTTQDVAKIVVCSL